MKKNLKNEVKKFLKINSKKFVRMFPNALNFSNIFLRTSVFFLTKKMTGFARAGLKKRFYRKKFRNFL